VGARVRVELSDEQTATLSSPLRKAVFDYRPQQMTAIGMITKH